MQKLTIILIALLAITGSAFAQIGVTNPVYCGDLSEADCAILTSVTIPDSASFSGEGVLDVTAAGQNVVVDLDLDGSYIADGEIVSEFMSYMESPETLFETMYADVDSLLGFMSDYFNMADADMTLTVNVPEEVTGGMVPSPLAVDLWLVEGVAYADIGAFSFADPTLEGVYGIDLVAIYTELLTSEELQPMMDEMLGAQGDLFTDMAGDMSFMEEFTTITRLPDAEIDGQSVAVFETTIDYGVMFSSEFFRSIMESQIDAQMEIMEENLEEGEEFTEEELEQTMNAILDAYAIAFEGTEFSVVQSIGLEDGYVYSTELDFYMDIQPQAIMEAFAEIPDVEEDAAAEMQSMQIDDIIIDFTMSVSQSDFSTIESIDLPEDAQVLPSEMFSGM